MHDCLLGQSADHRKGLLPIRVTLYRCRALVEIVDALRGDLSLDLKLALRNEATAPFENDFMGSIR